MADSEGVRSRLYGSLAPIIGEESTEYLLSTVPRDLDELATKTDIHVLKTDIESVKKDVESVRKDIELSEARLQLEIATQIATLRKSMHSWNLLLLLAIIGAMSVLA